MNIQMKNKEVLSLLDKHRQNHINEYANQVQGWKEAMENFSQKLIDWKNQISEDIFEENENHKSTNTRPQEPQRPVSYVKDYDKMIELLGYHIGDTITLEEYEFNQVVKDEFGWKGHFMTNSALYSSK
ncbi:hypothetical protein D3C87_77660 [compost metagenome]